MKLKFEIVLGRMPDGNFGIYEAACTPSPLVPNGQPICPLAFPDPYSSLSLAVEVMRFQAAMHAAKKAAPPAPVGSPGGGGG